MALDEGRWASMERIAQHVASTSPGARWLTMAERFDACLDAIVQYVADNGWPERDFKDIFRAASAALMREGHERVKHIPFWAYWYEPPGGPDALAEAISDRVGVHQLCYAFTSGEWEAVWSLAESIRLGQDHRTAAARIGISPAAMSNRLHAARQRARALWVCPGDTPPPQWRVNRRKSGGPRHKAAEAAYAREARARRRAAS